MKAQSQRIPVLVGIKLLHTATWLLFAGCIVAIPFAGARSQFLWAAILTGLVLVECAILAVNRGRCPLTDLAGRYTEDRTDNNAGHTCEVEKPNEVARAISAFVDRVGATAA